MSITYKDSGVDIEAGNDLVAEIKEVVTDTHDNSVIQQYGGFAALVSMPAGYKEPVLVSCTDGVGTKLKLAIQYNLHETIGQDLVAMSVNDLYCTGAKPLFFLDYFATGKLDPEHASKVIRSIADACMIADCSLVGGETAEMPGMYINKDYDLAGFCVGVVERSSIHNPINVHAGQVLIGLPSVGPHSNGYSLIRKLMESELMFSDPHLPYFRSIIAPTKIYTIMTMLNEVSNMVNGVAHITGGGLLENIPRMLPDHLTYDLEWGPEQWPGLYTAIQRVADLDEEEMLRTFNCGIGMVLAVDPGWVRTLVNGLDAYGEDWVKLGTIKEI